MISKKIIEQKPLESFHIDDLKPGSKIPFDVYIKDKGILIHYLNKGTLYTVLARDDLKRRGITKGYVPESQREKLEEYITKKQVIRLSSLENPITFQKYCQFKENHFQINKSILNSSIPVPFQIFIVEKLLIRELISINDSPNKAVDSPDIEGDLFIKKENMELYLQYLQAINRTTGKDNMKFIIQKEQVKTIMKNLLDNPKQGEKIEEIKDAINNIIESIIEDNNRIYDNFTQKNLDSYTYNHCLNVAILSIRMAIELNLNKSDIENLALGALLHDIGKSVISPEIINKQGKLTSNEYKLIRMHVLEGEKILREYKNIHEDTFIPVLQHHEKLTGNGYPLKLKGKEIKLFGRICAIADCYDSLTSNRPFRVANTPFYALTLISREKGDFDPNLLKLFIKMLGHVR
ncbi:MAG TPA: HD domain-containing protein [Nitrospirae bacterium]|nr:HD domain-containing protein [Nitrospirota bacterium]